MTRIIKFRMYDKKEKKMLYQFENCPRDDKAFKSRAIDFNGTPFLLIENMVEDTAKVRGYVPALVELMQYTGLKDKNGKEIYEDDILQIGKYRVQVEWDNNFLSYVAINSVGDKHTSLAQNVWEVVGNIYDNPEPLVTKKGGS